MSSGSKLLQLSHEAYCLATEQETILHKLQAARASADNLLILDRDLNDSLARAVSAASEAFHALSSFAAKIHHLEELDSHLTPPEA